MLTDTEKDWIKSVAGEMAREVCKEVLLEHIVSCPHGKAIYMSKCIIIGISIGTFITGGGVGMAVARLLLT